jgi:predicted nucleic acid-binding protein
VPFVIDASVVGSWHFADERTPDADRVLDASAHDRILVPAHWWFEIRNVLLVGERRGRASQQQTEEVLRRLANLQIDTAPVWNDADIFLLARRHRLTFYDAAYLELARREEIALATFDRALLAAAKLESVPLAIATE